MEGEVGDNVKKSKLYTDMALTTITDESPRNGNND